MSVLGADRPRDGAEVGAERAEVFAFDDRQVPHRLRLLSPNLVRCAATWRTERCGLERVAIVCRIKLPAERCGPARRVRDRRKQRRRPLGDPHVGAASECRDGEIGAGQALDQRRREAHRKPVAALGRPLARRFQIAGIDDVEPAGDLTRGRPSRCGDEQEPDAAVNRKHAALVLDADDGVDIRACQQRFSQRRAAVVGGQP